MIAGGFATRKLMAHFFSVSEPTISKWVDQGAPCLDRGAKGRPAKFDVREFLVWWREHVLGADDAKAPNLREREQMVDIELKELRLRHQQKELVERAAAVHVIRGLVLQMSSILRQSPRRHAHRLVNILDMASAVEVATAITEEQLADLRVPDAWDSLATESEDSERDGADAADPVVIAS